MSAALRKVSIRNLLAHKVRLLLTVLAVVLGTAFVAGSFIFTNTLKGAFDEIVSSNFDGIDAVVSSSDAGVPLDAAWREKIAADPEVKRAAILSTTPVVIANSDREQLRTSGAPVHVAPYYDATDAVSHVATVVTGAAPHGTQEVAVHEADSDRFNIKIGDELILIDSDARRDVTVSAIVTTEVRPGGAFTVYMDAPAYIESYLPNGVAGQLGVSGKHADSLVEHLTETYPQFTVRSGADLAAETTDRVTTALSFINYFLLAFGLIALFVGTFIIANTFAMIVAQRQREFALLRSIGTSQRQLTRGIVFEAILVGVFGSILGVAAGFGLVRLILAGMAAAGMELPNTGMQLSVETVLVPLIVGTVVTVLSAWAPARRAGQVRPVAAMRQQDGGGLKARTISGLIVLLLGVAAVVAGGWLLAEQSTESRASVVAVGAVCLITGVALFSPAIVRVVVPALGTFIGLPFRAVGKLAATNSQRNPRRTATTAFALALGIGLVTAFSMLGTTMKASLTDFTDNALKADLVVSGPTGGANGQFSVPEQVVEALSELDEVETVTAIGFAPLSLLENSDASATETGFAAVTVVSGDPTDGIEIESVAGDVTLKQKGVLVSRKYAANHNLSAGDTATIGFNGLALKTAQIVGVYAENDLLGDVVVSSSLAADALEMMQTAGVPNVPKVSLAFVPLQAADGVDVKQLKQAVESVIDDYIVLSANTKTEFAGAQAALIDQMLNVLYGLLALALIVAVLGIVNTLALNVIERRQEIGMLRAVGTHRRQVRTMITLEAVQIAVYGALLGVGLGLTLGWAFIRTLDEQGLGDPVINWQQLGLLVLFSAVVGVIAAVLPARNAARTPPLEAITD
ncbi:ABC transporter permease [Canibacter zhoujuaniae]|uniref:ABC transporter permease n=1 Tax=Canibacter zhoujuaniae TaxID=2708343 RepID=UPI00141F463D|nr:ABC transporter permease [Canibacter zhoujuaniae]